MNGHDPKSAAGAKAGAARDERLAKALRDNLRRRKGPPPTPRTASSPERDGDENVD